MAPIAITAEALVIFFKDCRQSEKFFLKNRRFLTSAWVPSARSASDLNQCLLLQPRKAK